MPADKKDLMPAWKAVSREQRLRDCITMLAIHGIITDGELPKIRRRLQRVVRGPVVGKGGVNRG